MPPRLTSCCVLIQTTTVEELARQVDAAAERATALERAADDLVSVRRVRDHLSSLQVPSAFLKTAPDDYYSWKLEQRA